MGLPPSYGLDHCVPATPRQSDQRTERNDQTGQTGTRKRSRHRAEVDDAGNDVGGAHVSREQRMAEAWLQRHRAGDTPDPTPNRNDTLVDLRAITDARGAA